MREQQIQLGQQWLVELLKLVGIPAEVTVQKADSSPEDSHSQWLIINETDLNPEEISLLLGEKGKNIDAIQYLANTLLNIGVEAEDQGAFIIELNGYRVHRQAELQALAETVAKEVRETGKEQEIRHLSSAERRQVHTLLQDAEDLETESRGQEPDRRLVVRLRS